MAPARTGQSLSPDSPIPNKLYFKIGEVSQLVGVRAHVLRYWEKEISSIRPSKSASNQRRFRRKDVEVFREIRRLLYEERYTLAGAKKRLTSGASGAGTETAEGQPVLDTGAEDVELGPAPPPVSGGPGQSAASQTTTTTPLADVPQNALAPELPPADPSSASAGSGREAPARPTADPVDPVDPRQLAIPGAEPGAEPSAEPETAPVPPARVDVAEEAPQLPLGFDPVHESEKIERVKAGLRELIRLAQDDRS